MNTFYGNYLLAGTLYYLSNYRVNVLPTVCYGGVIYKDRALLDETRFNNLTGPTGVIVSTDLVIPSNSPYPQSPSCTVSATEHMFGNPDTIVPLSKSDSLLVYNHGLRLRWRSY